MKKLFRCTEDGQTANRVWQNSAQFQSEKTLVNKNSNFLDKCCVPATFFFAWRTKFGEINPWIEK